MKSIIPLSGWQDSNLRPPAPKAGAMTGLRYTPNYNEFVLYFNSLLIVISYADSYMRPSRLLTSGRDDRATLHPEL